MIIVLIISALVTGVLASLGLGGGMVLIICLTTFMGVEQLNAQGINLMFFIPIASLALIMHTKNRLVEWKKIIPSIACGVVGAIIGTILAKYIGSDILSKIFGGFMTLVGIKELFYKKAEK